MREYFYTRENCSGKKRIKTVYPVVFSMEPIRINSDSGKNSVNGSPLDRQTAGGDSRADCAEDNFVVFLQSALDFRKGNRNTCT